MTGAIRTRDHGTYYRTSRVGGAEERGVVPRPMSPTRSAAASGRWRVPVRPILRVAAARAVNPMSVIRLPSLLFCGLIGLSGPAAIASVETIGDPDGRSTIPRVSTTPETPAGPTDRIRVRFAEDLAAPPVGTGGSVLVMLLPISRPATETPAAGPWWSRPHPFAAVEIDSIDVDEVLLAPLESTPKAESSAIPPSLASDAAELERGVDATTTEGPRPAVRWYPGPPESLMGSFRVQAVFRPDDDPTPGGPGERRSRVVEVEFDPDREDRVDLVIDRSVPTVPVSDRVVGPGTPPPLIRVDVPSRRLEAVGAASPRHRAWVVFPRDYHDLRASRRTWPTVYLVPHAGDGRAEAEALRDAISVERTRAAMPQVVWVVLDPRSPWGHHGFVDSDLHGPRATALVEEFIPELERRHRLVGDGNGRLLAGHGAGGWSAIRLQLDHPERFAKAFVTSPELVDLSRLGWLNVYGERAFVDEEGRLRPAYREVVGERDAAVRAVIEQEWAMAETASPSGRSGNRWHRWAALASPPLAAGERPPPLFDEVGRIDRDLAETRWLQLDLAAELVRDPGRLIPLWSDRVRVWVGSLDESGHERALLSMRTLVAELAGGLGLPRPGRGIVRLVPGATFETVVPNSRVEVYRQMIEHLEAAGLSD